MNAETPAPGRNVVVASPTKKRSLIAEMAERYGMDAGAFQQTIRNTVVPSNATNEEFAAFLLVARNYNLNPVTKEIYAFKRKDGGIQPIVSVDGWANLVNSNPQCDGFEFVDTADEDGNLIATTCVMYRKDRNRPTSATEYLEECRRNTDVWRQWPRRMLKHKAFIQAARLTFGFAGIVDPDEAERMDVVQPQADNEPPPAPTVESARASGEARGVLAVTAEIVDEQVVAESDGGMMPAEEDPPPAPISEEEQAKLDRQAMRGEVVDVEEEKDELAEWLLEQCALANSIITLPELERLDDEVCRELDGQGREDLRPRWNEAYSDRKRKLRPGPQKKAK